MSDVEALFGELADIARLPGGLEQLAGRVDGSDALDIRRSVAVLLAEGIRDRRDARRLQESVLSAIQRWPVDDSVTTRALCAAAYRLLVHDALSVFGEPAPAGLFELVCAGIELPASRFVGGLLLTGLYCRALDDGFAPEQRRTLAERHTLALQPYAQPPPERRTSLERMLDDVCGRQAMMALREGALGRLATYLDTTSTRIAPPGRDLSELLEDVAATPDGLVALVRDYADTSDVDVAGGIAGLLARATSRPPLARVLAPIVIEAIDRLAAAAPLARLNFCTAVTYLMMFGVLPVSDAGARAAVTRLLGDALDDPPLTRATAAATLTSMFLGGLAASFDDETMNALKHRLYSFESDREDASTVSDIHTLKTHLRET